MLETLKEIVFKANLELVQQGLVIYTWGNVSGYDPDSKYVIIKPSGVDYDTMKVEDMVVVDLDGQIIEGSMRPSSDTPTHLELYKEYPSLRGIAHTHSMWATSFAQAQTGITPYGTTHADYFYGPIPCTRELTQDEVTSNYEINTGRVIIETLRQQAIQPLEVPGILVGHHGPFTWGHSPENAVHNAKVLEEVAKMAYRTVAINPKAEPVPQYLLDKHYFRKHGKNAYYGQQKGDE
ncbi:L-ribulose-5-phosphate 4-epimerase [Candidatus Xianfuyuplasma coldseepsis]|uniref:L-ribulose-5-phosphate 4-epimerase n=1 Tax=Candidatus Xianfuyuplasma coldseepsis TaxID=2782163 RepID=A0A7L7KT31_9MOLU|nr:L-ribulose-5-phosphate 4-epimerase [Xianfuyuplasma coldseepsis]QMS85765.1 L-ribulose-5-phosphate 4-epimerase [Xianfuyuplasma coldseepsis]